MKNNIRYTVYLGLGSNLGNRQINLKKAVAALRKIPDFKVTKVSRFYKTKPVGFLNQPDFFNAVVAGITTLSPNQLLRTVKRIEHLLGRKKTFRWGPRVIDIDILFYARKRIHTKKLIIPHPRIYDREFVLKPLYELTKKLPLSLKAQNNRPKNI